MCLGQAECPEGVPGEHEREWLRGGGTGTNSPQQVCQQLQVQTSDGAGPRVSGTLQIRPIIRKHQIFVLTIFVPTAMSEREFPQS